MKTIKELINQEDPKSKETGKEKVLPIKWPKETYVIKKDDSNYTEWTYHGTDGVYDYWRVEGMEKGFPFLWYETTRVIYERVYDNN